MNQPTTNDAQGTEMLRFGRSSRVPLSEFDWRFSGSGGPGGQHANTSNTRVEVLFDIESSPSISDAVRARLMDKLGPVARATASDQRSQWQNRRVATERLRLQLDGALKVERRRVATRPTLGSKTRRLEEKRRTGQRKAARRRPSSDD